MGLKTSILSLAFLGFVCGILEGGEQNLLPNPSFEEAAGSGPSAWKTQTWGGRGEFQYASVGRTGSRSVLLSSMDGADISWYATVPVKPFSVYRLSGWIKTENVELRGGEGALLNLHNLQGIKTPAVSGTRDWTQVNIVFETAGQDNIWVNCLLGGWGRATGKAWFDDLKLVLISMAELKPEIRIDAAKTGEPISKYIYGQFIEHLGRCIYGGIWAEMLEDRKFWSPVGQRARREGRRQIVESPWKAIGDPGGVKMVQENSYVGEQTPRIELGESTRGIVQGGLGLVRGKKYVGRVVLSGSSDAAPVEVSLVWGEGRENRETVAIEKLTETYTKTPIQFTAGGSTDQGRLEIAGRGKGWFSVGTASLMPGDNVHGMRSDTLKLLKELDSPIYRWPGGNFVSGYDWKDGIGERDRRPPRKNPAWRGIEHNDFGIDEFIVFCRELNTEPLVVVNSGAGGVEMAVEELQYANGGPDTPMGRLRAKNGNPRPHGVRWWGIGNEMYGNWQIGHMPLERYILKHNGFAKAMRAADPDIKLVAVGAVGNWSEQMLNNCADNMDLISEHFYCQSRRGLLSHVRQIPDSILGKARAHRLYRKTIRALEGKDIRISMDEWNYWYGPHLYGELGTRYFLRDALGIAAGLNEYARQSDIIFMANYAQTVNVIGCIKTTKTAAALATTGLPLKLYRHHFGQIPVTLEGKPEPLDVAAAWTEDRKALTVAVVNPTRSAQKLLMEISGANLAGTGRLWTIGGPDDMAYNEPGKKPQVTIEEKAVSGISGSLDVTPISISLFRLDVK